MKRALIPVAAILVLASPGVAAAFEIGFSWSGTKACSSRPPAFSLGNVPAGTQKIVFTMVDLQVPKYPHGGGSVAYSGKSTIPAGAFRYTGPCPPSGQRHTYQWTAKAVGAGNKTLGTARAKQKFPPN